MKYAIGIVTFNPEIDRLRENLAAAATNRDAVSIIIADNGSANVEDIRQCLYETGHETKLIEIGRNSGIAHALNELCAASEKAGCEWIVTLDDDSVLEQGIIKELAKHTSDPQTGIICPRIEDRNMGRQYATTDNGTESISHCITSGNLVRLSAWRKVGGFREELFIDGVDFDFCIKMRNNGFRILRVNDVFLMQEVGHGHNVTLFGHTASVLNHSPLRLYYITRNYLYLGKLYSQRFYWTKEVLKRAFIVAAFEHGRIAKLSSMLKGWWHFRTGKFGNLAEIC